MSPFLHRQARGQAAAMMALTMALIALMVCITLGVGMKVREKMEAQTLADTSAYSGAVLTARTFNSIAILNRVEIADMVTIVATQSLMSYGSYYRAMLWSASEQLQEMHDRAGNCPDDGVCNWCSRYQAMIQQVNNEAARITKDWDPKEKNATLYLQGRGAAGSAYGAALSLYTGLYEQEIVGLGGNPPTFTNIVQRVAQNSDWPAELTAPATANAINSRELGEAANCDVSAGQLICKGGPPEISIQATMGTRWYAFERDTNNLSQMVENGLMAVAGMSTANGEAVSLLDFHGSSRFVDRPDYHGRPGGMGIVGESMEGKLQLSVKTPTGCGPQVSRGDPVQSWMYSTSYLNKNDYHYYSWLNKAGGQASFVEPLGQHEFPNMDCPPYNIPPCGMWPGFMDINPGHVDPGAKFQHLYGQPKVTAVVQRDYVTRGTKADPWNLLYTMSVRRSDPEQFDNNGIRTAWGLDISRQTAIASGLAYYHRQGHWKEPPNLYNPYWRATLVSNAIDTDGYPIGGKGGQDLQNAAANAPFAQDVINQLAGAGFYGWQ